MRLENSARKRSQNETDGDNMSSYMAKETALTPSSGGACLMSPAIQKIKRRLQNSARKRQMQNSAKNHLTSSPGKVPAFSQGEAHTQIPREAHTPIEEAREIRKVPMKSPAKTRILLRSNLSLANEYISMKDFASAKEVYCGMESEVLKEAQKLPGYWCGRMAIEASIGTKETVMSVFEEVQKHKFSAEDDNIIFSALNEAMETVLIENVFIEHVSTINQSLEKVSPAKYIEEDSHDSSSSAIYFQTLDCDDIMGNEHDAHEMAVSSVEETPPERIVGSVLKVASAGVLKKKKAKTLDFKSLPTSSFVATQKVRLRGKHAERAGSSHALTQVRRSVRLFEGELPRGTASQLIESSFAFQPNTTIAGSYFSDSTEVPSRERAKARRNPSDEWKILGTKPSRGYPSNFLDYTRYK